MAYLKKKGRQRITSDEKRETMTSDEKELKKTVMEEWPEISPNISNW